MEAFEPHAHRKRFGQHFLVDAYAIDAIIRAVGPAPGEHVIEIGPGEGVLTGHLVDSGAEVLAIEIDRDLVQRLGARYGARANFHLHAGDVLKFDFAALPPVTGGYKVVGNLPYNISTPLILALLRHSSLFSRLVVMVQREVAERLAAAPGGRDYGRLGIMVQRRCRVRTVLEIGPDSFDPPPKVDSSVVELVPEGTALDEAFEDWLGEVVRVAFSARRKTLANALRGLIERAVIESADIEAGLRPEQLSVADFVRLARVARPTFPTPR